MKISNLGLALIKHCEGCSLHSYRDPAGVWTIGYGHTQGVHKDDRISPEEAERLLLQDISKVEGVVESILKQAPEVYVSVTKTNTNTKTGREPVNSSLTQTQTGREPDDASLTLTKTGREPDDSSRTKTGDKTAQRDALAAFLGGGKGVVIDRQYQMDALCSFAFNCGATALKNSSLAKAIIRGEKEERIRAEFDRWVHAGDKVLPGLVIRRQLEADLYFGIPYYDLNEEHEVVMIE